MIPPFVYGGGGGGGGGGGYGGGGGGGGWGGGGGGGGGAKLTKLIFCQIRSRLLLKLMLMVIFTCPPSLT